MLFDKFDFSAFYKLFFKITCTFFVVGWILYFFLPVVGRKYLTGILSCESAGGVIFTWQVFSRYVLGVISVFLNIVFYKKTSKKKYMDGCKRLKFSSFFISLIICVLYLIFSLDGTINYWYGCGNPHGGWVSYYVVNIFEMNVLNMDVFLFIFLMFFLKMKVENGNRT